MTRERPFAKGEYKESTRRARVRGVFASPDEVRMAYDHGEVHLQAQDQVPRVDFDGKSSLVDDHGRPRRCCCDIVPEGIPFEASTR